MCCLRPQPEQAHAGRHRLHRQGDTTAAGHPPPELVGKDRGKTAEEERRALHRRAGDRVQVRQVGALLGSECGRRGCRDSAGLRPGVPTLAHLSQSMGTTCSSFESTASSVAAHSWLLPAKLDDVPRVHQNRVGAAVLSHVGREELARSRACRPGVHDGHGLPVAARGDPVARGAAALVAGRQQPAHQGARLQTDASTGDTARRSATSISCGKSKQTRRMNHFMSA